MNKLTKKKDKFLLSIPESISMLDALDEMAPVFVAASNKDQKKPIGNIENYVCFHEELKIGVYKHEGKYFISQITHPKKKLGINIKTTFLEISEILTDANDDAYLERSSIAGATLFGATTSKQEKAFLKALTEYDKLMRDSAATDLKEKIKSKKENVGSKDEGSSDVSNEQAELSQEPPKKGIEETSNVSAKKEQSKENKESTFTKPNPLISCLSFVLLPPFFVWKAHGFRSFTYNIIFIGIGIAFPPVIFLPFMHGYFCWRTYQEKMKYFWEFHAHEDAIEKDKFPDLRKFMRFRNFLGYSKAISHHLEKTDYYSPDISDDQKKKIHDDADKEFRIEQGKYSELKWFSSPEALRLYKDEYAPFSQYCLDTQNGAYSSLKLFNPILPYLKTPDWGKRCAWCDAPYALKYEKGEIINKSESYKYANKDGSPDKRHKSNPLETWGNFSSVYKCELCSSYTGFCSAYTKTPIKSDIVSYRKYFSPESEKRGERAGKRTGTDWTKGGYGVPGL